MNSTPESHRPTLWIEDLGRDVRLGLRSLLRSPAFATVAVLCLALGIGANAALFSVLNAVLLRPLPFVEPDRLVRIYERMSDGGQGSVSFLNFQDWQKQNTGFERLAGYEMGSRNLQGSDTPERIRACETTPELFSILRVSPLRGRAFQAGTDGIFGFAGSAAGGENEQGKPGEPSHVWTSCGGGSPPGEGVKSSMETDVGKLGIAPSAHKPIVG